MTLLLVTVQNVGHIEELRGPKLPVPLLCKQMESYCDSQMYGLSMSLGGLHLPKIPLALHQWRCNGYFLYCLVLSKTTESNESNSKCIFVVGKVGPPLYEHAVRIWIWYIFSLVKMDTALLIWLQ